MIKLILETKVKEAQIPNILKASKRWKSRWLKDSNADQGELFLRSIGEWLAISIFQEAQLPKDVKSIKLVLTAKIEEEKEHATR